MEYSIKKISVFGDKIILNNGSQWVVSGAYTEKCANWYETQRILIKEINTDLCQYQLVNVDNADIVEALSVSGYP